ncbi:hypothetical protein [Massilia sp. TN1-12]|uniref:hypothetical protein n=1 Tax=Massilia paldalensis TaxID=3377675 RepID=UPI00384E230A
MSSKTTRYTIDLDPAARDRLHRLAKAYQLTQGEVIEVLVEDIDMPEPDTLFDRLFKSKRQAKLAQRAAARETMAKLKSLSPDELADILGRAGSQ